MKFPVAPASTRSQQLEVFLADMRPTNERKLNISAVRNMIRCAREFGVDSNFNDKMRRRNPGIYANPVFKSPEVSM